MVLVWLAVPLAPVLGGYLVRWVGVLDERHTAGPNAAAFFVALPTVVFVSTGDRRPDELASPALVGGPAVTVAVSSAELG